jgi:hypothetical protein
MMSMWRLRAQQILQSIYLSLLTLYFGHIAHLFGLHKPNLRHLISYYIVLLDYLIFIEYLFVSNAKYFGSECLVLKPYHIVL